MSNTVCTPKIHVESEVTFTEIVYWLQTQQPKIPTGIVRNLRIEVTGNEPEGMAGSMKISFDVEPPTPGTDKADEPMRPGTPKLPSHPGPGWGGRR